MAKGPRKRKKPEVTISVMGQMVMDHRNAWCSANELEAIGAVFTDAAMAMRNRQHGEVICMVRGDELASVGMDYGIQDDVGENGLTQIRRIAVGRSRKPPLFSMSE